MLKQWITNGTAHPFYARKELILEQRPQTAVIAVCGLGQFQLYVNGRKVSDRVLDPAWTDYNKRINYITFDIAGYLKAGKNVIAAEVGNGGYLMDCEGGYSFHFPPFMPPNPNPYRPFGSVLVLAAHLEMTFGDGTRQILDADESWKVAEHPVTVSNVYGSEILDGRKRIPGWNTELPDDSGWKQAELVRKEDEPKGVLTEQTIPPVRVIRTYDGVYFHQVNGRAVYDFGQNTSGMLEMSVKGKKGDVIKIYPAEKLAADGDVDQMAKNWLPIDVCETYIIGQDDAWETFAMTFTYFGGRYVAVEGCGPDRIRDMKLKAITSAVENAGRFTCDNRRYLQIYDLVEKAVEANMLSVHTDCPTIERFAWQEENHLMAPAIMYMKQVKPHWEKFLLDTRTAQHTGDDWFFDMDGGKYYPGEGLIPSQAPCYLPNVLPVPGLGDFYDVIGWGSSIIIGAWWQYQFYGDTSVLQDNYEAGKRYLAHLKSRVNADGFISHGLGDWGNPAGEFAKENVETAFLYADAKLLAEFASILLREGTGHGRSDAVTVSTSREKLQVYEADRQAFLTFAEEIRENYNEKLLVFDEARGHYCYRVWSHPDEVFCTQAAEAMPLFWGMVPEAYEKDVVKSLEETMLEAGSFQSGEVGQPYIIQTLSEYGRDDLIAELILKETHPSYYAFVKDGETTLGEYWEENPRSHNHDMMGHIVEWYYRGIAGIQALEPGFRRVRIRPYLPKTMNSMRCTFHSASGDISVRMERDGGQIRLEAKADQGIEMVIDRSFLK